MRVVVTGAVEIGKSTVVQRVLKRLRRDGLHPGGVLTTVDRQNSKWVHDLSARQRRLLGHQWPNGDVDVGRYGLRSEAMAFANEAIVQAQSADFLIIDELGSLELKGQGFTAALEAIRHRGDRPSLLVIRQKLLDEYAEILGPFDFVFPVTADNRDRLHHTLYEALTG